MPMEVTAREWATFIAAHKASEKRGAKSIEHTMGGKLIAKVDMYATGKKTYTIFPEVEGVKNGYVTHYNGQKHDVWADSMLIAVELGRAHFKPPRSQRHMVTAVLAVKDGKQVTHSTVGL